MRIKFFKRSFLQFLFFALTIFVGTTILHAQQYNFLRYSVQNGLPQSQVNCVYQDNDGFIWIGTQGGVSRFDGRDFESFDDSYNFQGDEVTAIIETKEGILLGTDSGIVIYNSGKFTLFKDNPVSDFTVINQFFYGLADEIICATDRGLFRFENGKFSHIITSTPLDQLPVKTGFRDSKNNLWIGTESNGLFELKYHNGNYANFPFADQEKLVNAKISGIVENEPGEIWIATFGNGLFSYDGFALDAFHLPEKINTKYFTCMHKDMFGDIWIGTSGNGVLRYTQSIFKIYNNENGLGNYNVTCLNSDKQGNTWIGTFSAGLVFFSGDQFTSLTVKDGMPDNDVRSIVMDDSGDLWFATQKGLAKYDDVEIKNWTTKDGLSENSINALATDGKKIFVGTANGDLDIVDNGKISSFKSSNGIDPGEISSMLYSKDGSVWVGTVSNGLFRFANNKLESFSTGNTLLRNSILDLYESDDGIIWIGTEKGIFFLENGNAVKPLTEGKKPPSLPVYGIQSDETYIYFSTQRNGIWRYHRKKHIYQRLDKTQGLASDFTKGILRLDDRTMYVITMLGFDRIISNPDTDQIRHFYYSDGIGTDNFNEGVICAGRDGKIWLGSKDGVIIYSPSSERVKISTPQIQIKEVDLFNQKTDWQEFTDSILRNGLPYLPVLPSDKNQITFHLSAVQFGAGINVHYEYKLEGLEKKWNSLASGNSVSYSNLLPGNYRFLVRAKNSNDMFSDPYIFAFTIKPPFYGTWWFYLSVIGFLSIVGILLIFLYQRFRTEFLRRNRSFVDYTLNTGRMLLLISGVLYPASGFLIHLFSPTLIVQLPYQIIIGTILFLTGVATFFYSTPRKYIGWLSPLGYSVMIVHILYLNYSNHLDPITVIMLAVALGGGGVVLDNIRTTSVFSAIVLIASVLLMFTSPTDFLFNRWLFLLVIVVCQVITFISVLSRLNLFNRLVFADTTINNSRSIVIAADHDGKIIFVSRSIRSLLGYSEEEVMGDGWWKLRSEDAEENERIKNQVFQSVGTTPTYVTAIRAKNGSIKWIQWSDTELEGGIKVGIGLDVSDRREIEERYRHIIESATDIIYTADYLGNFTYINDVVTKITGYTNEELIGKNFTIVVRPDWLKEVMDFYQKQFSKKTVTTYLEFPTLSAKGETIWLGQTVRILFDETKPTIITGFQAIARDITEKKRYEEELEKLSLVASETINGVLICNPLGMIEWVNDGFTKITGYELNEVEGKLPGDVLAGNRTDISAITEVRERSKVAEGFHKEFLVYHKNGNEIWIAVSNTPIVDERGNVLKQIEIFNDITEKKRYEIQLDKYSNRLETLNLAKEELLRSETTDEVAENVLGSLAQRITYLKRTSVALFDFADGFLELLYVLRDGDRKMNRIIMPMDSFRSLPTLRNNEHVLINDLANEKDLSASDLENLDAGVHSYLVMPLYSNGELIGSVNLGAAKPNSISADDVEMVREVADAMANSFQQLRYRNIIEQKNADISSSILYAKRIQEAILPPEEMLREQFGDLFLLYRPKDVLSGDFYWAEKRGNHTFLAVVDSTGHGVPGALLSLMGQNLLNQAVHERHFVRPAAILDYLNVGIQHTLNQYKKVGELRDGMDITLCVFENDTMKMQFAGAINPMYIIRDGMLIESKGNRFSIGSYFDNRMRPFTNQETTLQAGDIIYLFTDGYSDQFGGEDDRKMSLKRFRETLMTICKEDMQVQKKMLDQQLDEWMKGEVQTDDICVIGIRIGKGK